MADKPGDRIIRPDQRGHGRHHVRVRGEQFRRGGGIDAVDRQRADVDRR